MHVIGQLFTLLYVALVLNYQVWVMLLLTPFVVYPFAWAGHYVFEKNKWDNNKVFPFHFHSSFRNLLKSCDLYEDKSI